MIIEVKYKGQYERIWIRENDDEFEIKNPELSDYYIFQGKELIKVGIENIDFAIEIVLECKKKLRALLEVV